LKSEKCKTTGRETVTIQTKVNGLFYSVTVPAKVTLAELLREKLNLTGTKLGCNRAECGVCTVLLEGVPVFSCTVLAADTNGKKVETIEGLAAFPKPRTKRIANLLQEEFVKNDALQCGYCTPGILLCLKALLERKSDPSIDDVKEAIAGNYCRCGAYPNIFNAAMKAIAIAKERKGINEREEVLVEG
jgi:aerobic-type carbon monoxide dehydrogenase small subunit (CoxS/CutS family)